MRTAKSDLEQHLVEAPSEDFMCAICKSLLRQPVQCLNGHVACASCLSRCSACPICRVQISEPSRSLFVERLLANKRVFCKYRLGADGSTLDKENGCPEVYTLEEREGHLRECPHRWVTCAHEGCTTTLRFFELAEHSKVCLHRVVECVHCGADKTYLHSMACSKEVLLCPLGCGEELVRGELTHHKTVCSRGKARCTFSSMGCIAVVERCKLAAHLERANVHHTELLRQYMMQLEGGVASVEHRLVWRLKFDASKRFYRSKSFSPTASPGHKFYVGLWPRGESGSDAYCALYVFLERGSASPDARVSLAFTLTLVNAQYPTLSASRKFRNIVYPIPTGEEGWGERKMLRSDMLSKEAGFVTDDDDVVINATLNVLSVTLEL